MNWTAPPLALLGMLSLPLGAASAREGDDISRSFRAAKGGTLTPRSDRGSVEVQTAAIEEVTVMVSRRVRWGGDKNFWADFGIRFEQSGEDVFVRGEFKNGRKWRRSRALHP